MSVAHDEAATVSLGSVKAVGLRLVANGRFGGLSEDCRAGLRSLEDDARLAALGQEGLASGVDDAFDIDTFVEDIRANA